MSTGRKLSLGALIGLVAPAIGLWVMVGVWQVVDTEWRGDYDWGVGAVGAFAAATVAYSVSVVARVPRGAAIRRAIVALVITGAAAAALVWAFTDGPWRLDFTMD